MKRTKIAEVRDNLSKILREVEDGERVLISRHGTPIAELRPVSGPNPTLAEDATEARVSELEREGLLRRGTPNYPAWLAVAPRGPAADVLGALLTERKDGR